ncbi:MAG: 3-deoxy-D-manno-octulosonic acid transferase [Candidatus Omnitrophica bacterium]|nr:3-deoxy-D-manno-octulosonic acid transferase [Candidatus Omnitrophota bacterium]
MRILYDIAFIVFGIIYFPYLVVKGKMHKNFMQKFAFLPKKIINLEKPVWIHGVSVGEAVLAVKLASAVKEKFPDRRIVVSTTTETGMDIISRQGKGVIDGVFYYPFDLSVVVNRAVRLIDPEAYIMVETEIWPNLLGALAKRNIPAIIVNGRISDNSFKNYRKIKFVTRRIFRNITCFCMQSERDVRRIKELGADADATCVNGNMKFDGKAPRLEEKELSRGKLGFNDERRVLVAGSTHFPEEQMIVDIYKDLKRNNRNLRVVLVPRHVKRCSSVSAMIEKNGLKTRKFSDCLSENAPFSEDMDVLLVDTIGHLKDIYAVADVVFIGGSLASKGGQNPIEPAMWGKPVIFGPEMFNFRKVADIFIENSAAICVKNSGELKNTIETLLKDPDKRTKIAKNALKVISDNSGAVERTVEELSKYIIG